MTQCFENLQLAVEQDFNDHLAHFYLALTYSLCRQVPQALVEVRTSLRLRGEHLPSLLLLSLLMSTSAASPSAAIPCSFIESHEEEESNMNQCQEALSLLDATLEEYPENFDLLYVKTLLEERCYGGEIALISAKHMLAMWKLLYDDVPSVATASENNPNNISSSFSNYDNRSVALSAISAQHVSNEANDRESKY